MGATDLGNLVGLGCKNNFDVNLSSFLHFLILTYKFVSEEDKANKISSFIAILGLINIPIIKYSVEWWNTLHQPASIKLSGSSTIHSSMLTPLLLMFFYCCIVR